MFHYHMFLCILYILYLLWLYTLKLDISLLHTVHRMVCTLCLLLKYTLTIGKFPMDMLLYYTASTLCL
jgi:hypothetical protein